jgi:hypothetical protein
VEPTADEGGGSVLAGVRFIARSAVVRASLVSAATINFFNLMFFALALLFAVRELHLRAGLVGLMLGGVAGAILVLFTALPRYRLPRDEAEPEEAAASRAGA